MHGHKITNQNGIHFLTMTVVGWIDVFTRSQYCDILKESLEFCQKEKGLVINAYVIMSNHLHLIAYANEGFRLSDIIRDFKKFTSKQLIKAIKNNKQESRREWMLQLFKEYGNKNKNNDSYQFWIQDNKPTELISPKWIRRRLGYVHLNPVRAGIVDNAEDYVRSSARQYAGKEGWLRVQ